MKKTIETTHVEAETTQNSIPQKSGIIVSNLRVMTLTAVLTVLGCISARRCNGEATWREIDTHSVYIEEKGDGCGSGVALGNNKILTVNHLFDKKGVFVSPTEVMPDKKTTPSAKVVKQNKEADLMLLESPIMPDAPEVEMRNPVLDEKVIMVGFPRCLFSVIHGRVARVGANYFFVDANLMGGTSGAGVFSEEDGKLLGIIDASSSDIIPVQSVTEYGFIQTPMSRGQIFIAIKANVIQNFLSQ